MVNLYARALLCKGNKVLLLRRCNLDFGNGLYSLCGGRVEQYETARQAIMREVYEEVHLSIPEPVFELVHLIFPTWQHRLTMNQLNMMIYDFLR